nr:MAG TPA: hypothetical protein [Caudoviricetes sp.]
MNKNIFIFYAKFSLTFPGRCGSLYLPEGQKGSKNMKVKDFSNWQRLIFRDRAILKSDLRYMSWQQVRVLEEMDVLLEEDGGETLILENR